MVEFLDKIEFLKKMEKALKDNGFNVSLEYGMDDGSLMAIQGPVGTVISISQVQPVANLMVPETVNVQFTSVWDSGEYTSSAKFNPDTGHIFDIETVDGPEDGSLIREYITLPDGEKLNVCTDCHEYIKTTVMVPDNVGKGLHEEEVCIDKECSGLWAEDGEPNED